MTLPHSAKGLDFSCHLCKKSTGQEQLCERLKHGRGHEHKVLPENQITGFWPRGYTKPLFDESFLRFNFFGSLKARVSVQVGVGLRSCLGPPPPPTCPPKQGLLQTRTSFLYVFGRSLAFLHVPSLSALPACQLGSGSAWFWTAWREWHFFGRQCVNQGVVSL